VKITLVLDQRTAAILLRISLSNGQTLADEASALLVTAIHSSKPRRVHRNKYFLKSLRAIDAYSDATKTDSGNKNENS
jgi:hypothetical protein